MPGRSSTRRRSSSVGIVFVRRARCAARERQFPRGHRPGRSRADHDAVPWCCRQRFKQSGMCEAAPINGSRTREIDAASVESGCAIEARALGQRAGFGKAECGGDRDRPVMPHDRRARQQAAGRPGQRKRDRAANEIVDQEQPTGRVGGLSQERRGVGLVEMVQE